jgi:PAS domain S-box-containing protein
MDKLQQRKRLDNEISERQGDAVQVHTITSQERCPALSNGGDDEDGRVRHAGSPWLASQDMAPVVEQAAELDGLGKAIRHPSGRRIAAEANHQSEELLRLLLDGACDCAVHVLDTAGHIVGWSKGAELLTGYHAEEVMAQHYGFLFRREDRAEGFPGWQLQRALVHGRIEEEGWLLGKDGAAFWAHFVLAPIHSGDGAHAGFAKVARDTRDQSRLRELEQSLQRTHEFLATLGHELRTPLAPMRYALFILQRQGDRSASAGSACRVLERQVAYLGRMLDDLLEVGRVSSGRTAIRPERLAFERVVRHAVEAVWPIINDRFQTIETDVADPLWVMGDEVGLIQVLQNLLSNAAKFTHEGGSIRVSAGVVDERLCVQVADNGQGMDPETIDKLFVLFAQGRDVAHVRHPGLGIGLALARAIVEMHGGTIAAFSPGAGQGSVFSFYIPLRCPQASMRGG